MGQIEINRDHRKRQSERNRPTDIEAVRKIANTKRIRAKTKPPPAPGLFNYGHRRRLEDSPSLYPVLLGERKAQ